MKININVSDDLLKRIDDKAKSLNITRTAYICMSVSNQLNQDSMIDMLPKILDTLSEKNIEK